MKIRRKTEKGKVVVNTASKLYDSIFNVYKTQYKKPSEYQKKNINILNRLESLSLDFIKDDLPPMSPFKVTKKLSESRKKLLLKEQN